MTELAHQTALELAAKIRNREVSSVELTELYIDRIERLDGDINAVVVRTFDDALTRAREADGALARGTSLGPLHGVPMTIKESYAIGGTHTTWGNELFRDNVARADGLAVQRFRAAGAHFLGKTNVPVDLADFQSFNPIYGTTRNPWNVERTPGGSSGGSAAALAAGFTALEAGSDIGGSIRNPAHFCGVYGHKPTYAVIPMSGHELVEGIPDADLAVCGPLARGADDLHLALDIMAGPAPREALAWRLELPAADFERLADLRVALWPTDPLAPVAEEIAARVALIGEVLEKAGATVSRDARPDLDLVAADRNYQTLLNAVMTGAMTDEAEARMLKVVDGLAPDDVSRDAVAARAAVMRHREWIRTNTRREKLRRAWARFFEDWDILVCPQMATPAFPHDHRPFGERTIDVDGVAQPYFQQLLWAGMVVNAYLPSTVFPTGPSTDGLPIGLQAVSAPYRDHRTIAFAEQVCAEIGGFLPPPGY
ncbi:MAG: amidase [Gammaproteobacteria bacterium]|nr:amidase [Gammaproteobacteria bacterium]